MDPHCALKVTRHLLKNKRHYHHNAIDRFGFKIQKNNANQNQSNREEDERGHPQGHVSLPDATRAVLDALHSLLCI
jgi:hypothetical protein